MGNKQGSILLVGAGPGDPELLTLKALGAIQTADIILYDTLVSDNVLALSHPDALKIPVGKKGYGPSCRQDDINVKMLDYARAGKKVVRLKGGDPLIFSRAGEEISAAKQAGIPIHIIPGITSAQAAAATLGVPLTHRKSARRLQFVTGHDHEGGLPTDIDWKALADPAATTVVYMGKKTFSALSATLMQHGLSPHMPAVAIMDTSLPTECIVAGTIADLPEKLHSLSLEGPVILLIGQTLA